MAAAGSATLTEITHKPIKKIKFAWTCDASGNVSGGAALSTKIYNGKIIAFQTIPAGGGNAPTDNYDIVLNDADGVDVLLGAGQNRDTANTESVADASLGAVVESTLELVVSNAGNAKQGTAYVFIR